MLIYLLLVRHAVACLASRLMVLQLWPKFFSSAPTVLCHVVFRYPLLLFPSGVQWIMVFVMELSSFWITGLIHIQWSSRDQGAASLLTCSLPSKHPGMSWTGDVLECPGDMLECPGDVLECLWGCA